jgi:hypothetical protein
MADGALSVSTLHLNISPYLLLRSIPLLSILLACSCFLWLQAKEKNKQGYNVFENF